MTGATGAVVVVVASLVEAAEEAAEGDVEVAVEDVEAKSGESDRKK